MEVKHINFNIIFRTLLLPTIAIALWLFSIISLNALKLSLVGFVLLFVVCPLLWKFSAFIQKSIIFLNYVQYANNNLGTPEKFGMEGARNFYIRYRSKVSNEEVKLGVWHILPEKFVNLTANNGVENSSSHDYTEDEKAVQKHDLFSKLLFRGDTPVVLYAHGNAYNRGIGHRLEMYKLLQGLQYHIITFDYRGYGDSSWLDISELGLVEDTIMVYKWILENVDKTNSPTNPTPIYIWGHSLGTGISMHTFSLVASEMPLPVNRLHKSKLRQPNGIILESPFNNMSEEMHEHILGKVFSWLPWFNWMIIDAIEKSNITFKSDEYITEISTPILIFHAEDDIVIPHKLGKKLYYSAVESRPNNYGKVEFMSFKSSLGLGHKYICRGEEIPDKIRDFVKKHNNFVAPLLSSGDWQNQRNVEEREIVMYNSFN